MSEEATAVGGEHVDGEHVDDEHADAAPTGPPPAPLIEPTPSGAELEHPHRKVLVQLDWVTVLVVAVGIVVAWVVLGLFSVASATLTKIAIGIVLALALDTVVDSLKRRLHWPRGAAVAFVMVALLGLITLVFVLLGPPAVDQARRFGAELPETVEELYSFPLVGDRLERADAAAKVDEWMRDLPARVSTESITEFVRRAADALTSVLVVLLVTFAVLLDGELIVSRIRRLFPTRHRDRADWAGRIIYRTLGRYFAGSMLLAVSNGLYILAVGLALGVPLAPLAAIWAMLMNLVPQIGGFLGGLVFVTLAVTDGVGTGVIALVLFLLYNSTDNYLLQPLVVGSAVRMSPPGAMLAAFIGAAIAGIPGALVATPLVGAAKLMYTDMRYGPQTDQMDKPAPSRIRRALGGLTRWVRARFGSRSR